jgi:hypothetical protein
MQIPLSYAEAILGTKGSNIALIRRSSGAFLTVQESRGLPDEITVEIKGTSSQVQTAQHMIQVGTSLNLISNLYKCIHCCCGTIRLNILKLDVVLVLSFQFSGLPRKFLFNLIYSIASYTSWILVPRIDTN